MKMGIGDWRQRKFEKNEMIPQEWVGKEVVWLVTY